MRVLIAVSHGGIYSGGAFQAAYQLAGLKHAGVDVMAVWGPDINGDPHGFDRLEAAGVPYKILPIQLKPTLESLKAFRKVLVEFKPDVVECFKSGAQYHAMFGGLGLNSHVLIFYRGISRNMDLWQGIKYRFRRVDGIIANSTDLKNVMSRTGKIPPEKISVVFGEYDPACGNPDKVDITGFRKELNIPEEVPLITQLGNWSEWRGQKYTLQAGAILKEKGYRFHLAFVGKDTDKLKPLVTQLKLNDVVTLSPFRRDPERVLKASDIAINASTSHESLPGSMLNAQATGLPCITTDLAGGREAVEDGVTGFIIPPADAQSLAMMMVKMLEMGENGRRKIGDAARQRALRLFSPEARTKRRLKVYEKAIEHRRKVIGV